MSRAVLILASDAVKLQAHAWIAKAPWNTRLEFKGPKRSLPQNDRMWAMLTDVASQLSWQGLRLSADDWKTMFMDRQKREARMVPNLDLNGMVNLGRSSSDLSREEMSDLIEIIAEWGASHGVEFHDEQSSTAGSGAAVVAAPVPA